jgi:hypothetical protein
LPEDLHQRVRAIARDTSRTFSETATELMRRGLSRERPIVVRRSKVTGLPVVDLGIVITTEDVKALDDEE